MDEEKESLKVEEKVVVKEPQPEGIIFLTSDFAM